MQCKLVFVALLALVAVSAALNVRHMGSGSSGSSHHSGSGASHKSAGSGSSHKSSSSGSSAGKLTAEEVFKIVAPVLKGKANDLGKGVSVRDGKAGDLKTINPPSSSGSSGSKHLLQGYAGIVEKGSDAEKNLFAKASNHGEAAFLAIRPHCGSSSSGSSGSKSGSSAHKSGSSSHHSGSSAKKLRGDFFGELSEATEGAEAADADEADGAIINEAAAPAAEDSDDGVQMDEMEDQDNDAALFLELPSSGSSHGSSAGQASAAAHSSSSKHSSSAKGSASRPKNVHSCCFNADGTIDCHFKGSSSSGAKKAGSSHSGSSSSHHSGSSHGQSKKF